MTPREYAPFSGHPVAEPCVQVGQVADAGPSQAAYRRSREGYEPNLRAGTGVLNKARTFAILTNREVHSNENPHQLATKTRQNLKTIENVKGKKRKVNLFLIEQQTPKAN